MSVIESNFIKYFISISAGITLVIITGVFSFWSMMNEFKIQTETRYESTTERINYVERMHKQDVTSIKQNVIDIKEDVSEINKTQKEILKALK